MKKKLINILFMLILLGISVAFFSRMNIPKYFIGFLFVSAVIIYFLSIKKNFLTSAISIAIVIANVLLFLFAIIPTYSKEVNISGFYNTQENYLTFTINDSTEILEENMAKLRIIREDDKDNEDCVNKKGCKLSDIKDSSKIFVKQGDIINFISNTKDIKTTLTLYMWDGTIIKILPQTTIVVNKIWKDEKNPLNSKTEIGIDNGNILFKIIRTIIDKDGFNIKTQNGTLVIRGTEGFISEDKYGQKTILNSYDHIIEIITNGGKQDILLKGESSEFTKDYIKKLNINEFVEKIGTNLYNQRKSLQVELNDNIKTYQENLENYIVENFGWKLHNKGYLEKLSEFKLDILTRIDNKYEKDYSNYQKYQVLLGKKTSMDKIGNDYSDIIITPTNSNLNDLKIKFLEKIGNSNIETAKSYMINLYNKLLDQGKNVNINDAELTKMLDSNQFDEIKSYIQQNILNKFTEVKSLIQNNQQTKKLIDKSKEIFENEF